MTALQTRETRPAERVVRWSSSLRVGPTAAVLGTLAMVVTWAGSWNPSFWGDEAATVMSAERPLGILLAELGNIDAVHGLYYVIMHFWIGAFGGSELSTRLPSAIAVGVLVAGVVVLGARLAGLRYGIVAALVCALLPRTTYLATEARSYAIGTAVAVWATVFFVGLLRRRETRIRSWVLYGVLIGLAAYLFLYLILLAVVHGTVLVSTRDGRALLGRWLRAGLVAVVVAAPIIVVAVTERHQVAFLAARGYATPYNVLVTQWFGDARAGAGGTWLMPILGWALILIGVVTVVVRTARRSPVAVLENRESDRDVVRLGVAWLAMPTLILLAGNAWVSPVYNVRYLSFSTPAAALLISVGAVALARFLAALIADAAQRTRGARAPGSGFLSPRRLTVATVLAMTVLAVTVLALGAGALPSYLFQRGPFAKDGGSDWRQVADYVQADAARGDAIVFDETTRPSRRPELAYRLYPTQFAAVDAVQIVTPYDERAHIWDVMAPLDSVWSELARASTVWALELPNGKEVPADIVDLTAHGYRVVDSHLVNRIVVYELQKESA